MLAPPASPAAAASDRRAGRLDFARGMTYAPPITLSLLTFLTAVRKVRSESVIGGAYVMPRAKSRRPARRSDAAAAGDAGGASISGGRKSVVEGNSARRQ